MDIVKNKTFSREKFQDFLMAKFFELATPASSQNLWPTKRFLHAFSSTNTAKFMQLLKDLNGFCIIDRESSFREAVFYNSTVPQCSRVPDPFSRSEGSPITRTLHFKLTLHSILLSCFSRDFVQILGVVVMYSWKNICIFSTRMFPARLCSRKFWSSRGFG